MKKSIIKGFIIGVLLGAAVVLILVFIKFKPLQTKSAEADQSLYQEFLSRDIFATGEYEDGAEYSISANDLEIGGDDWDAYQVYGYLDADNDGKDELVLQGPYGAYILDANKGKLNVFAHGDGTGNTLLLSYYEDAYWIVYSYLGADESDYYMSKYKGADTIEDSFYYGKRTDESGSVNYFRGDANQEEGPITEEEFSELQSTIVPLYKNEDENFSALLEGRRPPITEEEINAFKITCEADDALGFENFDDFDDIMEASFVGTWYDPVNNEALRIFEDGCYIYMPWLEEYGDHLYEWELKDRSDRGLCPMMEIYYEGREIPGIAYYIGGKRENYFWCNAQQALFYKQEED